MTRDEQIGIGIGIFGAFLTGYIVAKIGPQLVSKSPSPTISASAYVPVQFTGGRNNVDLGGGWKMLDVSNLQSDTGKQRLAGGLTPNTTVTLVLDAGGGPIAYLATVAGGTSLLGYTGQWTSKKPPGGPQMIDFGPEHVLI